VYLPRLLFWRVRTADEHIKCHLADAQFKLSKGTKTWSSKSDDDPTKCWSVKLATKELRGYARSTLMKLLVPYMQDRPNEPGAMDLAWGGLDQQIWCECRRTAGTGGDGNSIVYPCARCHKLRFRSQAGLATGTTPPATTPCCMRCRQPHVPQANLHTCFSCARTLHDHSGSDQSALRRCTYDSNILKVKANHKGWLCPDCTYRVVRCVAQDLLSQRVRPVWQGQARIRPPGTGCTQAATCDTTVVEATPGVVTKSTDVESTRRPYRSPGHQDYHQKHDDDRASVRRALHEIGPSIERESSGDKDATRRQGVHVQDSGTSDLYARSTAWTDHARRTPLVSGKKRGRGNRSPAVTARRQKRNTEWKQQSSPVSGPASAAALNT
jgi:hypothetical protein